MANRTPVFGEYLEAIDGTNEESALRELAGQLNRDHRAYPSERQELMKRIGERIEEVQATTAKPAGGGAPAVPTKAAPTSPPSQLEPAGAIVTAEGAPEEIAIEDGPMPVIPPVDPVKLAAHLKRWNGVARVIEANVRGALVKIPTKRGLQLYRARPFYNEIRVLGNIEIVTRSKGSDSKEGWAEVEVEAFPRLNAERRVTAFARADRSEKGREDMSLNQLMGLAWTRASNRATRELVGFGDPSAEEVEAGEK